MPSHKNSPPAKGEYAEGGRGLPKLRFPEFRDNDEWQTKPLSSLAERCNERNTNSKHTRVLTNSAERGVLDQRDYFEKDIANQGNLEGYYVVEKGDYVYNPRISSSAPVGPISKNSIGTGVMSPLYTIFRFKGFDNRFYEQYFKSTHWHAYMRHNSSTGARHDRMAITTDDFMRLPLPAPTVKEQQKIADFLTSLDEVITAEAQKLDALKAHKKGLMQGLFPDHPAPTGHPSAGGEVSEFPSSGGVAGAARRGGLIPKLRFPEFRDSGEWILTRLERIGKVAMCKRIFAEETNGYAGVPFYKIGTLGGQPDAFISQELYHKYRTQYSFPKPGEILITCSGTVGKCIRYDGQDAYYQDSNIVWIENTQAELSNELLYYLLSRIDWTRLNSNTITRIYGDDLRNLLLAFPTDLEEQQDIADCLTSLDELIAAQAEKIEALKAQKKGLLQGLFPQQGSSE